MNKLEAEAEEQGYVIRWIDDDGGYHRKPIHGWIVYSDRAYHNVYGPYRFRWMAWVVLFFIVRGKSS